MLSFKAEPFFNRVYLPVWLTHSFSNTFVDLKVLTEIRGGSTCDSCLKYGMKICFVTELAGQKEMASSGAPTQEELV